jgi:cobalt/nickel transport system permease protein
MHIADGILSAEVSAVTAVLAAGAVGYSLRQLDRTVSLKTVPLTSMLAALIFAGQMVKFPLLVVPAYGHLLGGVLAAVVAGPWAGCVALTLVLFLQMALFADGGWLAFGANVLNMGVVGSLGGYAIFTAIRRRLGGSRGIVVGSVVAAWVSVVAGSALFCVEFAFSQPSGSFDVPKLVALMTSFHSLVGVGEALITGGIVSYVVAQRPDLVVEATASTGRIVRVGRLVWTGTIAALLIAAFVAPFATEGADGLEAVAERMEFDRLEESPRPLVFDDYAIPLPGVDLTRGFWQKASVSLAGVFGTGCVLAMAFTFGRLFAPRVTITEANHGG